MCSKVPRPRAVTHTWWVDEPTLKGSANPRDEDLAELRAQGFTIAVSLLEENKQPPRYDKASAQAAGWSIYPIPIEEKSAPSLEQIYELTTRLEGMPSGAKLLVFCESGLGRTAFMGAAYWVDKGLSVNDAIAYISQACRATDWVTADRRRVLAELEQSMKG
jgi:protein-tyrosine phosphatase